MFHGNAAGLDDVDEDHDNAGNNKEFDFRKFHGNAAELLMILTMITLIMMMIVMMKVLTSESFMLMLQSLMMLIIMMRSSMLQDFVVLAKV